MLCDRAQTSIYQFFMAHILILKYHCLLCLLSDKWQLPAFLRIRYEILTVSEPHLKRAVLLCWHCLRPITFSFGTCAKVIRQDNEVLASNDSHQHCSISYVKLTDPGYWLYWRARVSFWKLKNFLHPDEMKRNWERYPVNSHDFVNTDYVHSKFASHSWAQCSKDWRVTTNQSSHRWMLGGVGVYNAMNTVAA